MDWYTITEKYDRQTSPHGYQLTALPEEWQRELAALWRLEAEVNNGGYLQFVTNCGRESYTYASRALKKIGALQMSEIVETCQALVDEHFDAECAPDEQSRKLMPNRIINAADGTVTEAGSILPESVINRIYDLSYRFIAYPDDLAALGLEYYGSYIDP